VCRLCFLLFLPWPYFLSSIVFPGGRAGEQASHIFPLPIALPYVVLLPLPVEFFLILISVIPAQAHLFCQADYFPDYTGGDNYDAAYDYLFQRFALLNHQSATKQIRGHCPHPSDHQQLKCEWFPEVSDAQPYHCHLHAISSPILYILPREQC
jgi:hypothetical protein